MKFKKILIILILFIFCKPILAKEFFVYCSDKNQNWHWLDQGNYKVTGTWEMNRTNQNYYFYHFVLDGGISEYQNIRLKCIKEFGKEFHITQPAYNHIQIWVPFSLNGNKILQGHISKLDRKRDYVQFKKNM